MKQVIPSLCILILSISVISCSLKKSKQPDQSYFNPQEKNKGAVIGITSDLINDYIKELLPQLAANLKDMPLPVNDKDLFQDYYLSSLSLSFDSTNPANIVNINLVEPDGIVVDVKNLTVSGKAKIQHHKKSNYAEITFEANIEEILMHLQLEVFKNGEKYIPGASIKGLNLNIKPKFHIGNSEGVMFFFAKIGNTSAVQKLITKILKGYLNKNLNSSIRETINKNIESILSSVAPIIPINTKFLKGNLNLGLEKRPTIIKGALYVNVDGRILPMSTTTAAASTTTPTQTSPKKLKRKLRRRFKKL